MADNPLAGPTPIVRVRLKSTNFYSRRGCLVCGNVIDDEAVNAVVWSATVNIDPALPGEQRTGHVVCDRCLDTTPAVRAERLRDAAAWHEERARELRHIAAHPPAMPTAAERRAAADRQDAVICFARSSARGTVQ